MPKLLILMDVNMPEMNGIEATTRIKQLLLDTYREQAIKENLKIIAVSAQEENSIAQLSVFDQ